MLRELAIVPCAMATLAVCPNAATARPSDPPAAAAGGTEYWEVVARYASGARAAALSEVDRLPDDTVLEEVSRLRRLAQRAGRCAGCPEREELERLALTEAALLHGEVAWWSLAGGRRRRWQLERARDILDAARPFPTASTFARRLFQAATLRAHAEGDWGVGEWVASEGLKRFPEDPALQLALGTLLETVGWRAASSPGEVRPNLERAEALLARVDGSKAQETEARLRLAHVRWRLGLTRSAREALEALNIAPLDRSQLYLAQLFLGGVLESEGRPAEAMDAYRRSLATWPGAQAGGIALSHGLAVSGDEPEARAVLEETLGRAGARGTDPFWHYPWGHSGEADALFDALREEAARCCR